MSITSTNRKVLLAVFALAAVIVVAYALASVSTSSPAHAAPVDYRVTIYSNPDPDGGCRIVAIDERPLIAQASFACPGGQKVSNMNPGDTVYAEGNPVTDGVYVVGRVAFTDPGERPDIGPFIDLSFVTSYAGQRYWVLTHR